MISLNSFLYKTARFFWNKFFCRFGLLVDAVEKYTMYPKIPHIKQSDSYTDGPILIAGFFNGTLGIGEGARLYYSELKNQGIEVYAIDICAPFNIADMESYIPLCNIENAPRNGTLLMHCNAPHMGTALKFLGENITKNRKIIAYWAWELEIEPQYWHKAYAYCDEIWVPSKFTAKAFAKAPILVKIIPHIVHFHIDYGHGFEELDLQKRIINTTIFLTMADCRSDLIRKNIYGSIKAFVDALGNNNKANLIIKLHHTEHGSEELKRIYNLCRNYNNVFITDKLFTKKEYSSLLHRCDVLISLHRSEGYGLHLAEALKIGKKVIATNYSGNIDFMNNENSILIPYKLIPVRSENHNYKAYKNAYWADADIEFASAEIKKVLKNE